MKTVTANIIDSKVNAIKAAKFLMDCGYDDSEYIDNWLKNSECPELACKIILVDPLCSTTSKSCITIKNKIKVTEKSKICND